MKTKRWIIGIFVLLSAAVSDAKEAKLALFPFDANAEEDLSNVQAGIAAMLPGRLSMPGQILVFEPVKIEPGRKAPAIPAAEQLAIAKKAGADYLLGGSITKLGSTISIDARLISTAAGESPAPLFVQSENFDALIPQLNILAKKARDSILEKTSPSGGRAAASAFDGADQPYAQPARTGRAYRQPAEEPEEYVPPPRRPGRPMRLESDVPKKNYGTNQPLFDTASMTAATVNGKPLNYLCAADINNDGKRELIAAGLESIKIFQFTGGTLSELADIPVGSDEHVVHVDAGDYNGNGIDELYVSCYETQNARSFVVEFQQGRFVRILERQRWFYRVYPLSDGTVKLLGQEAGTMSPFSGEIYLLQWKEAKLISREQFLIPGGQGLYGFGEGDVDADGTTDFLIFDKGFFNYEPQLIMSSTTGKTVWRDTKELGGTPNNFLKYSTTNEMEQQDRVPLRIICAELTPDGRWAVIAGKNFRKDAGAVASALMGFNHGQVQCLLWDGSDLVPNWTGPAVKDCVHDYILEDFDKDGARELIIMYGRAEGLMGSYVSRFEIYKTTRK